MKLYPLIIAVILGAATVSQGTVTFTNAGFELPAHTANDGTNPTGWTVFETALGGNPDKQIRTRDTYKNTGAMGVQVGAGNSNHDGELYQTVATVIGQEYTFSIYAAVTSGSASPATQNFTVDLLAGTAVAGAPATGISLIGNSLSQLATVSDGGTLGATFQEFTVNFTATSIDTTIWIYDNSTAAANDVNDIILDDVSITAVPAPATITWGMATTVSASGDVSTTGVLVEAFNAGGNTVADQTVNSVLFTGTGALLPLDTANSAFSGDTGDAAYNALLDSIDYGGGGDLFTISVGSGNLVVGEEYLIQVWYVDTNEASRVMQFGDGNGNAVGLASTPGQFATGTFTATNTDQALSLDAMGFGNAHLTAYQIRTTDASPTAALTTSSPTVVNTFTVTVTFSEDVTGLSESDFTFTNGSVVGGTLSGSGSVYTFDVATGNVSANVVVTLPANTVVDVDSEANAVSASLTLTPPGPQVHAVELLTHHDCVFASYEVTVHFDTSGISGLDLNDFAATNATLSNLVDRADQNFSLTVTPSAQGTVTLQLAGGSVSAPSGDSNLASNLLTTEYTLAPKAVINGPLSSSNREFELFFTFTPYITGFTTSDIQVTNGSVTDLTMQGRRDSADRFYRATIQADSLGNVTVSVPAGVVSNLNAPGSTNTASNIFTLSVTDDFGDTWVIDEQAEWVSATGASTNTTVANGIVEPTADQSEFSSIIKSFPVQKKLRAVTFRQSPAWDNWTEVVGGVGPTDASDALILLPVGDDDYYLLGKYRSDGYHAWHSTDMITWIRHGRVTPAVHRWVTTAEYKDGQFYIFVDYPNDHTPHLYIDNDLKDGLPGTFMNMVFHDPTHGSDSSVIRDNADGLFHIISEDWTPINARSNSWDSPSATHASSVDAINGFTSGEHLPPIDLRTTPTGTYGTFDHPHLAGTHISNPLSYEIHSPAQEAFGDWTSIKVGSQYYMFADFDHTDHSTMSAALFTSKSIYDQFELVGDIKTEGHPDPTIGFAEGQFYLISQYKDFISSGPWVEGVEARAGVDVDGDNVIDQWSDWQIVSEGYDHTLNFARVVTTTPAQLDLTGLPIGFGFQFEFRVDNTVVSGISPIMDAVEMEFEPSNFQQWANTNGIPAEAEADHNSNGVPDVIEFSIGQTVVPERQADGRMTVTVVNEAIADGMAVELWFTDDLLESWNVATLTTVGVKLLSDSTDVAGDHVLLFEIFDRNGTSVFWKLVVVPPE